jgi:hypothetical protein
MGVAGVGAAVEPSDSNGSSSQGRETFGRQPGNFCREFGEITGTRFAPVMIDGKKISFH